MKGGEEMITIDTDLKTDIQIRGHAGYAPAGSDIVCAAVSALYETLKSLLKEKAAVHEADGSARLILDPDQTGPEEECYLNFFLSGIQGIEKAYPQHVQLMIGRAN